MKLRFFWTWTHQIGIVQKWCPWVMASNTHQAGALGSTHPCCGCISHNTSRIQPFHFIHITQIFLFSHLNHCSIYFFGLYNHIPISDPESAWKDEFPRSHCDLLFASLCWLLAASLSCQIFHSHFQKLSPYQPYPFKTLASFPMLDQLINVFAIKVISFGVYCCTSPHTGRSLAWIWTFQVAIIPLHCL